MEPYELIEEGVDNSFQSKINKIILYTSDGNYIDVRNLIVSLDIYEYMFSPVITGSMVLAEGIDLVSNFSLHGNEFLEISIDKPGLGFPIEKKFRVYKIANRDTTTSLQAYILSFCSEEMILSSKQKISRSYKGIRISQIIRDILKNDLGVSDDRIGIFEETENLVDVIIPRMDPFEAINWLLLRARSVNKSAFFFYENADGFNLISYEELIKLPSYSIYTQSVKTDNEDIQTNENTFTVLRFTEDFDILKNIRYGGYNSTLFSLDLVSKQYDVFSSNAVEISKMGLLNDYISTNNFTDRFGSSLLDPAFGSIKFAISNDADTERNPIAYGDWLPQTTTRLALMHTFKVMCVLPGDPILTAGNTIEAEFINSQPQDNNIEENKYRSGRYLITAAHHKISRDYFTTTLELRSDSISSPLPAALQTSVKLNELKAS